MGVRVCVCDWLAVDLFGSIALFGVCVLIGCASCVIGDLFLWLVVAIVAEGFIDGFVFG